MRKWLKKKKGSTMMTVLVISIVMIFIIGILLTALVKTNTYNQKYNTNNDLEAASKSGLNIGRSELMKEIEKVKATVKNVDELQGKYVFDEKVRKVVGEDKYTYSVTATLDKNKSMYKLVSIATDSKGISMEETQNIYLNLNYKNDIASLVAKMNVFSVLGSDVPSVTITTTTALNESKVPNDVWYVESLKTDLNNKSYININNNVYSDEFVNDYKEGNSKIEIKEINDSKRGVWNSALNMLIDDEHQSLEIYSGDGSGNIIGYRKKINGVTVVLINGDLEISDGSYQFNNTILYVTGSIKIKCHDLRLNNTMLIAGENLNLDTVCILINSKPDYSNLDEIQEFIRTYIKE